MTLLLATLRKNSFIVYNIIAIIKYATKNKWDKNLTNSIFCDIIDGVKIPSNFGLF